MNNITYNQSIFHDYRQEQNDNEIKQVDNIIKMNNLILLESNFLDMSSYYYDALNKTIFEYSNNHYIVKFNIINDWRVSELLKLNNLKY